MCDTITMINKAKDRYKRLSKPAGGRGGSMLSDK